MSHTHQDSVIRKQKQRQEGHYEFEDNLVYIMNFRTSRAMYIESPYLKKLKKKKTKQINQPNNQPTNKQTRKPKSASTFFWPVESKNLILMDTCRTLGQVSREQTFSSNTHRPFVVIN